MNTASNTPYESKMFAPGPARDGRFKVVNRWIECSNCPKQDPKRRLEFLHRQMNEEINGMENAARSLTDFPEADWGIRMSIARQCADEETNSRAAQDGRPASAPVIAGGQQPLQIRFEDVHRVSRLRQVHQNLGDGEEAHRDNHKVDSIRQT